MEKKSLVILIERSIGQGTLFLVDQTPSLFLHACLTKLLSTEHSLAKWQCHIPEG
jgi:hypothetical protein